MEEEIILTEEGMKKLESELEELKTVKRREVAERLKNAISYGDLMENSEYDDAKNEQARIEQRIEKLETILAKARVVDRRHVKTKEVGFGSLVELREVGTKKQHFYRIVGPEEANPENHKISYKSPMGKALMGHKVGEVVVVEAPGGARKYRITAIKK